MNGQLVLTVAFTCTVLTLCLVSAYPYLGHRALEGNKIITGVRVDLDDDEHYTKRQSGRQPLRMVAIFDSSVDTELSAEDSNMIRSVTVPGMIEYFESALTVDRVQAPLRFDRECVDGSLPNTNLGIRGCETTCQASTMCGQVIIPEEHLKGCIECNGNANGCQRLQDDGDGVMDADIVLYISAIDTECPSGGNDNEPQTTAFAGTCQMEANLDRPIVGNVNFCPLGVTGNAADSILEVGIHEVMHIMAIAGNLWAFWRNEDGTPRTARDPNSGLPMNPDPSRSGIFVPSTDTIRSREIPDWGTINGVVSHTVNEMVTPAVVREAREQFNCSSMEGLEIENQGSSGTEYSHWESRLLGNEGMTGQVFFNPVFSRITLAAFEDSGWYGVNYDVADELAWGRNAGCSFVSGSCYDYIQSQEAIGESASPFCTPSEVRGCTVDHKALGTCAISIFSPDLPPQFQYFSDSRQGGQNAIVDFCPFYLAAQINNFNTGQMRGSQCDDPDNAPIQNILAESYSQNSRCIPHGTRDWTNSGFDTFTSGSGCYRFTCSPSSGVFITVANLTYSCECEGEEIRFSFTDGGNELTGSFICPSCAQLCFDTPARCPATETQCFGRITEVEGTTGGPPTEAPTQGGSDSSSTEAPSEGGNVSSSTEAPSEGGNVSSSTDAPTDEEENSASANAPLAGFIVISIVASLAF